MVLRLLHLFVQQNKAPCCSEAKMFVDLDKLKMLAQVFSAVGQWLKWKELCLRHCGRQQRVEQRERDEIVSPEISSFFGSKQVQEASQLFFRRKQQKGETKQRKSLLDSKSIWLFFTKVQSNSISILSHQIPSEPSYMHSFCLLTSTANWQFGTNRQISHKANSLNSPVSPISHLVWT